MERTKTQVVDALNDRFGRIGAALSDLKISSQKILTVAERNSDPHAANVYRNRLAVLLIAINHLKDDVKRLAKKVGTPTKDVESFCRSCAPITLCAKAAETYKHGLGGRASNNTVVKEVVVIKSPQGAQPTDESETAIAGALIVDENGDSFDANIVCRSALVAWVTYINNQFQLDFTEWLNRAAPEPKGPRVTILPGVKGNVPQGAFINFPLPESLRNAIKSESQARLKSE